MPLVADLLTRASGLEASRQAALDRAHADPGIPSPENTTKSFWLKTPHPIVAQAQSSRFPDSADIVIIGSGITGTSVANFLLKTQGHEDSLTKIVMLEARNACSGATGRNGGHIIPGFDDYSELKKVVGKAEAQKIVRLRRSHIGKLLRVAEELDCFEHTQARTVEALTLINEPEAFKSAKEVLAEFQNEMPDDAIGCKAYERDDVEQVFQFPYAAGIITFPAGAIWPYRLVTNLLEHLRTTHAERFVIETNTSVKKVTSLSSHHKNGFEVLTSRGTIRTRHVVHCTNGHVGHLVPGLRGVVVPLRAQMSAQTPGQNFGLQGDKHSWLFQYAQGFDYLTQLPVGPGSNGEMMYGGGINVFTKVGLDDVGIATDDALNPFIDLHLSGGLRANFGARNWGVVPNEQVKAMWTGTLGMSADNFPWVGKVPSPKMVRDVTGYEGAEWVCAGFSGEGMVHAWSCGEALVQMLLADAGSDEDSRELMSWFPWSYLISEERMTRGRLPSTLEGLY